MNGLDFILATQPRSGSHMLAFALDSHPEINMGGELYTNRYEWSKTGNVVGAIVHAFLLEEVLPVDKIICLTRAEKSHVLAQMRREKQLHYFEDTTFEKRLEPRKGKSGFMSHQLGMLDAIKMFDVLYLDYDELTAGKNITSIPCSGRICEFLGVENRKLTTKTFKPSITYVN